MNGELRDVERKLEVFRAEASEQFAGVRDEIKELALALRELIRLDGDLKRQNDALLRIGRQVDGHDVRLHEIETVRLPRIELAGATSHANLKTESKHHDRLLVLIAGGLSSLLTGLVMYLLTHPS